MKQRSLAITTGSSPGIGSYVVAEALSHLKLEQPITVYATTAPHLSFPVHITWHVVKEKATNSAALQALLEACDALSNGKHVALVTGPVAKSDFAMYQGQHLNRDKCILGHTEILGDVFGTDVCMMFLNVHYRVALMTQHIPLREVSSSLNMDTLIYKTKMFLSFLKRMDPKKQLTIGFCGLNPHAASDVYQASEEKRLIKPVLEALRVEGCSIAGPISPDTAFFQYQQHRWDGLISLYHDQALSFLKGAAFHQTVNVTLGLPFVRTSVDHGVGRDLQPSKANWTNMLRAIEWAILLGKL